MYRNSSSVRKTARRHGWRDHVHVSQCESSLTNIARRNVVRNKNTADRNPRPLGPRIRLLSTTHLPRPPKTRPDSRLRDRRVAQQAPAAGRQQHGAVGGECPVRAEHQARVAAVLVGWHERGAEVFAKKIKTIKTGGTCTRCWLNTACQKATMCFHPWPKLDVILGYLHTPLTAATPFLRGPGRERALPLHPMPLKTSRLVRNRSYQHFPPTYVFRYPICCGCEATCGRDTGSSMPCQTWRKQGSRGHCSCDRRRR